MPLLIANGNQMAARETKPVPERDISIASLIACVAKVDRDNISHFKIPPKIDPLINQPLTDMTEHDPTSLFMHYGNRPY